MVALETAPATLADLFKQIAGGDAFHPAWIAHRHGGKRVAANGAAPTRRPLAGRIWMNALPK
jgi:hypothetical protein